MGKKILKCMIFILIPVAVLSLLGGIFEPKNNSIEAGMHDEPFIGIFGEEKDSLDVIYIGNSECFCSIIPPQIWQEQGFTGHLDSSPLHGFYETYKSLVAVTENQHPKVVVLETDSFATLTKLEVYLNAAINYNFPAVRYHDRWRRLTAEDFRTEPHYEYTGVMKGYHPSYVVKPADDTGYMAPDDAVWESYALSQYYLTRIQEHCRKIGAELMLLSTPSTMNWSASRHNLMEKVSEERGIPYLDLNMEAKELGIDWSLHTRDEGDHLNQPGAEIVSRRVGEYLAENFDLTDHRGDPAYESWDQNYQDYLELLKEYEAGGIPDTPILTKK